MMRLAAGTGHATQSVSAYHDPPASGSLAFIEQMFNAYERDPNAVSPDWREYFESLEAEGASPLEQHPEDLFPKRSIFHPPSDSSDGQLTDSARAEMRELASLQERVDQLIRNYRVRGHIMAKIDPLHQPKEMPAELSPEYYHFTEADMNRKFSTTWLGGPERRMLRQIISWLQNTYCRSIGVQFMHIDSMRVRLWLQERMEGTGNYRPLQREEQLRIFKRLSDASVFEDFIQKKYISKKRFSLEGAESLIPLLDLAIEKSGAQGVNEIVLGHGSSRPAERAGQYHEQAAQPDFPRIRRCRSRSSCGRRRCEVSPRPQLRLADHQRQQGASVVMLQPQPPGVHQPDCHGPGALQTRPGERYRAPQENDAPDSWRRRVRGEGVIQESLNLSQLEAYKVGGTVHVVVNNQIGFTTTDDQARSCTYATDVARMLQIPVFHVNGEDPEAVAFVVNLALDFREEFQRDVVIDMYCYRRRGHNEGDEPAFTQPLMYQAIGKRPTVLESYLEKLCERDGFTREDAKRIDEQSRAPAGAGTVRGPGRYAHRKAQYRSGRVEKLSCGP